MAFAAFIQISPINIVSINVSDTGAGKPGLSSLCNAIRDRTKVKGSSLLSYLALSDNKLSQPGTEALAAMLSHTGMHLKSLVIANTQPLLDQILDAIKRGCPNLDFLDISRNKLKPADCNALSKFLESQNSLTDLNLSATKFPPECIKDLLLSVANSNVDIKINLSDNSLGSQVGELIASIAFKMMNVHTLNLADNDLAEEGISSLAEGLCSNTCLRNLILDRNWKSAGKARQDAMENLIKLIANTPYLEALSFEGKGEKGVLRADIVDFLYALGNNASLTSLNISGHQMGNKGAIALSKALQTNHTLTSLNWDDNMTTLLGFINIKNALSVNRTLKNMPLPVFDIAQALKNHENAAQLQQVLNKIETQLLTNQQSLNSNLGAYGVFIYRCLQSRNRKTFA